MNDDLAVYVPERDESDARGYSAIVKAAAKVACSPIVSREAQGEAEDFIRAEIERWSEHSPRRDSADDPADGDEPGTGPAD